MQQQWIESFLLASSPLTMGAVVTPMHLDVVTHWHWRERTMWWGCTFACISLCSIKLHATPSILVPLMAVLALLQVNTQRERTVIDWIVVLGQSLIFFRLITSRIPCTNCSTATVNYNTHMPDSWMEQYRGIAWQLNLFWTSSHDWNTYNGLTKINWNHLDHKGLNSINNCTHHRDKVCTQN